MAASICPSTERRCPGCGQTLRPAGRGFLGWVHVDGSYSCEPIIVTTISTTSLPTFPAVA